jgi:hypothetical protein
LSGTGKADRKSEKNVMPMVNSMRNVKKKRVWKGWVGRKEWVGKTGIKDDGEFGAR